MVTLFAVAFEVTNPLTVTIRSVANVAILFVRRWEELGPELIQIGRACEALSRDITEQGRPTGADPE